MAAIKCDSIAYRQGFIEVDGNIHPKHVNIEMWKVDPETDISHADRPGDVDEDSLGASVELELNIVQAKLLVAQLQAAIRDSEKEQGSAPQ